MLDQKSSTCPHCRNTPDECLHTHPNMLCASLPPTPPPLQANKRRLISLACLCVDDTPLGASLAPPVPLKAANLLQAVGGLKEVRAMEPYTYISI